MPGVSDPAQEQEQVEGVAARDSILGQCQRFNNANAGAYAGQDGDWLAE